MSAEIRLEWKGQTRAGEAGTYINGNPLMMRAFVNECFQNNNKPMDITADELWRRVPSILWYVKDALGGEITAEGVEEVLAPYLLFIEKAYAVEKEGYRTFVTAYC